MPRPVGPRGVWYEGSGTADRRWLHADERGSVIAMSNAAGTLTASFRFGPHGETADPAFSRFGFTGQTALPGTGLLHFKARAYSPALGRFLQPDPIGQAGGLNLYAYAGNDPVNFTDPSGLLFGGLFKAVKKVAKKAFKVARKASKLAAAVATHTNSEVPFSRRLANFAASQALDFAIGRLSGGDGGGADEGEDGFDPESFCRVPNTSSPDNNRRSGDLTGAVFSSARSIIFTQNSVRSITNTGAFIPDRVAPFGTLVDESIFGGFVRTSPIRSIPRGEFPSRGIFAGRPEAIVVGIGANSFGPMIDLVDLVRRMLVQDAFVVRKGRDGDAFVHGVLGNRHKLECN